MELLVFILMNFTFYDLRFFAASGEEGKFKLVT